MRRILAVDDKEENQYLLRALLEGNGFSVELAAQGAEALEKALRCPPDLVITDILMPVMDGFALCKEWRREVRLRDIPFIFYTATYTDDRDRDFAMSLGADRFLIKPEEPENLLEIIKETIHVARRPKVSSVAGPFHVAIDAPAEQEAVYLQQYNQVLVRKLEAKMTQLEVANSELQQDIAERQRTEKELREAEVRYRTLFEQSPDGIVIIDPETARPLEFNTAAHQQLGYSREEFARLGFTDIHLSEKPEQFRARLAGATHPGRVDFETQHRTRHGEIRFVQVTAQSINIRGNPFYHCIWRDITEHLKNERLARRSQRLESIGTLAGGVAHDLNNTLAPIMMGLGMLRTQYPDESELIDVFQTSGQRAADMVRQLLAFAKGAEGERISLQLNRLVKEVAKIVTSTFPKNIRIVIKCDDKLPPVLGDATQLHQVLLNLCVNARDAMPDGGTLTMETERKEVDAACASAIPGAKPGDFVLMQVGDTGTGIPPEVLDRIFDPFFTTKTHDKGTGLGLSTVLGIVKGHGGFMQVHTQPGQGSTFTAYLPSHLAGIAPAATPEAAVDFHGNGETVLFVDDDSGVREMARVVLRRLNFTPLTATDGADGLIKAAENRVELALVIVDMHMPHMDGLSLVRALRRMRPEIPILVASGELNDESFEELKALGITCRLDKPFTEGQLAEAMKKFLQKS